MKMLNKFAPLVIVFVTVLVYCKSFSGVFIFDDYIWIVDNENIKSFWGSILYSSRPLIGLTFYVNYLLGGLKAADYHAVNLLIHLASILLLFGILRRTFVLPMFRDTVGLSATLFAGIISLFWGIHPIQTESVTYIVQRSESLMGMFYLLTLYCFIRGLMPQSDDNRWFFWGIISCALGMLCKPVMVTAPLIVLLYDGTFLSGSVRLAIERHRKEYLLLAATLLIPAILLSAPNESSSSAGFGAIAVSPCQYFITQSGVLLHYVKLVLWPMSLCLDYDWIPANLSLKTIMEICVIVLAVVMSFRMFFKQQIVGFIGLSFFIMLFPSSGFIPLSDCAAEHRMYLPSVCVVLLFFFGTFRFMQFVLRKDHLLPGVMLILGVVVCVCLGFMTVARNRTYLSEEHMWNDVISKCPWNLRGRLGVGTVLLKQGNYEWAEYHFMKIVEDPRGAYQNLRYRYGTEFAMAYNNLGAIAFERKQINKAKELFEKSILFGKTSNAENNLRLVSEWQKMQNLDNKK